MIIGEIRDYRRKNNVNKKVNKMIYQADKKNETIDVLLWARWPSYDFIFGVPLKGKNKYFKEEKAYFAYRDTRRKKCVQAFYVDRIELKRLYEGFKKLMQYHKLKI